MAYAILRTDKLKSVAEVRRSMKHAFREQPTPNADTDLTPENTHIGASNVAEAMRAFHKRLPDKYRKDAVLAIEYLVTASPEGMKAKTREQQDAYFKDALDWMKARHGEENVVYAGIHRDETTPHMYAYVVPRVADKLNCRAFLGGAKALSDMQTEFADLVGKRHDLERGIKGSKEHHTRISQYYARVGSTTPEIPAIALPEPTLTDRLKPREYREKVRESVLAAMQPGWETLGAKAVELEASRKRIDNLRNIRDMQGKAMLHSMEKLEEAEAIVDLFSPAEIARAQERRKQALLEKERQEKEEALQAAEHERRMREQEEIRRENEAVMAEVHRRFELLKNPPRNLVGAELTFALHSADAIRKVGGDPNLVDWKSVEMTAAQDAMANNGQSAKDVIRAIENISPGRFLNDQSTQITEWVKAAEPTLEKIYASRRSLREQDRDLDR